MKIVIIGGGPGGYVAALRAAILGAEVVLVENKKLGGTCLNLGCIPTKAFLKTSEVLDVVKHAKEFGILTEAGSFFPQADFSAIMKRKNTIVQQLKGGIQYLLKRRKVTIITGIGRLAGPGAVEVVKGDETRELIEADRIILATGSVPVLPPALKYNGRNIISSDEALNLTQLPQSMIIVGGGVIGCEFGQFFSKLGTKVSVVEMAAHILPFEDADVARLLDAALANMGISIYTQNGVSSVEVKENGVKATLQNGEELAAEVMLVSVGRKANYTGVGIEKIGVQMQNGKIVVDDHMRTNVPGIYAIGDIVDSPLLAHVASQEGIIAVENALGRDRSINYTAVPRCIYTHPEVADVGITEDIAKKQGLVYRVGKFSFAGIGKALVMGERDGFIKILANEQDIIIGAAIVGAQATELLAELTLAVHLGLTVEQVGNVIHAHPTLSEGIMEALHGVHGECIHGF